MPYLEIQECALLENDLQKGNFFYDYFLFVRYQSYHFFVFQIHIQMS